MTDLSGPMQPQDPMQPRYDAQNRLLCSARRRDGDLCQSPAMHGQRVCRMHGGSAPQARSKARLRLAELVDPAIATLSREMVNADSSADRQRAANSILDRAGVPRVTREIEADTAREILLTRLLELRSQHNGTDSVERVAEILTITDRKANE